MRKIADALLADTGDRGRLSYADLLALVRGGEAAGRLKSGPGMPLSTTREAMWLGSASRCRQWGTPWRP
ncbi:MAG: hypothetical protein WAM94_14875 [Chromatiaceae bacterium]